MQEFPKALYRGDECRVVDGADQEAEARADGFRFWADSADDTATETPQEPVKRGPGRPKKVV